MEVLSRTRTHLWTSCVAWALTSASPGIVAAQTVDSAAAQALYDEGKALMSESRYEEACPKLEESQRLESGSGTLIHLAECYEHLGRTASAWSTFLKAAAAAKNIGNLERAQVARDRADALAATVPRLQINVPAASRVPGLVVQRDGSPLGAPQWGLSTPVDPGQHRIEATAPDRSPWATVVTIAGNSQVQKIEVPPLEAVTVAPEDAERQPARGDALAPQSVGNEPREPAGLGAQRTWAIVAAGIGVVGLGVGTAYGLKSMSKKDEASRHCDGSGCRDQTGVDLKAAAIDAGNVSTVGFIVGLAGVATGSVLWLTAGAEGDAPRVGIGPGSVSFRGAF